MSGHVDVDDARTAQKAGDLLRGFLIIVAGVEEAADDHIMQHDVIASPEPAYDIGKIDALGRKGCFCNGSCHSLSLVEEFDDEMGLDLTFSGSVFGVVERRTKSFGVCPCNFKMMIFNRLTFLQKMLAHV